MVFSMDNSRKNSDEQKSNYFIDENVEDAAVLEAALSQKNNTFHLFSHGKAGELFLNGKWLNSKQLVQWFTAKEFLQGTTNLNIYGCEFAKGEKGLAAVKYLETELGVLIAASINVTGKDGDWFLEMGNVSLQEFQTYQGNLQCTGPVGDCDGDGVPDVSDLDDDNDGILDSEEGYSTQIITIPEAIDFSSVSPTNNVGTSSGILGQINGGCFLIPYVISYEFISTGGDIPILEPNTNVNYPTGGLGLSISYDPPAPLPGLSGTSQVTYYFSQPTDVEISFYSNQPGNENVTFITPYDNITPGPGSSFFSITPPIVWHNFNNNQPTVFEFLAVTEIILGLQGNNLAQAQSINVSGFTVAATCIDTDNDGIPDHLDLDSDNDGCNDVHEAGFTDAGIDGILGDGPTVVNSDGLVIGTNVVDGYTGNAPEVIDSVAFDSTICVVTLPVELINFQAMVQDKRHVALTWQTVSEKGNDYFEIHKSTDLVNWEFVANVDGAGNSTELQDYSTFDLNPSTGASYYKLMQVDFNGTVNFGGIRSVEIDVESNSDLSIYPNPTFGELKITGEKEQLQNLQLFNSIGQQIKMNILVDGNNSITIDISNLESGVYLIRSENKTYKITKNLTE
jgi:hypothetical protein